VFVPLKYIPLVGIVLDVGMNDAAVTLFENVAAPVDCVINKSVLPMLVL
jgi:hypothetical protein